MIRTIRTWIVRRVKLPYIGPRRFSSLLASKGLYVTISSEMLTTSIFIYIKSRRLSLFGHVARMDGKANTNQILFEPTSEHWRKSCSTWLNNIMMTCPLTCGCWRQRDAAQNRCFWQLLTLYHRPLIIRTDGSQSRVRELGSIGILYFYYNVNSVQEIGEFFA